MFYMAIDGVAPRAKMNQQRSRRFRSALDAEEARAKALKNGLELPSDPFDSNAITPGTEFMAKLSTHLKYFIHKKISTDSSWQNVEIILSGHEIPGEGEHKIMHHIRLAKAQPGYSPNTRHCLYGLDADLIMLGLLSHDPHFAILREEVLFLPGKKKQKEITEENFYLLHLSIVREYLEMEFDGIDEEITFTYDFERILDDFILLNFFIGNDFLPELPSLLINDGALPFVIESYKSYLRDAKGYITKNGIIDFPALSSWIDKLVMFEYQLFEKGAVDLEWINEEISTVSIEGRKKDAQDNILKITHEQHSLIEDIKQFVLSANSVLKPDPEGEDLPSYTFEEEVSEELTEDDVTFLREFCSKTYLRAVFDKTELSLVLDVDGIPDNETDQERSRRLMDVNKTIRIYLNAKLISKEEEVAHRQEVYSSKFNDWKNEYYHEKFQLDLEETPDEIRDICENYLEGLQWVLLYYFRGTASWSWYFRYHYAPRISDIRLGLGKKIEFNLGQPFHPFEQLMAVLPERSKALVPPALRPLMTEENSPIRDFYPHTFEIDKNGKKASWEAVVKVPFVDEKRLIAAVQSKEWQLTPAEKKRNSFGTDLTFVFNPQVDTVYPSSLPGIFLNVEHDHTIEEVYHEPSLSDKDFVFGLCEGAKLGVDSLAGFPSLKNLPHTFQIAMGQVKVFERPSRRESIILSIQNQYDGSDVSAICNRLLGRPVYIGWPYLREAKVVAISDKTTHYQKGNGGKVTKSDVDSSEWSRDASLSDANYQLSGVKIGKTELVLHVHILDGMIKSSSGAYIKKYETDNSKILKFPLQMVVESVQNEDPRFLEKPALPVEEEFPVGSRAVSLLALGYGTPITVTGHSNGTVDVELRKLDEKESTYAHFVCNKERERLYFQPSFRACKDLHISSLFLSKITARMVVLANNKKFDIGLNIRNEGQRLKTLGYTYRGPQSWNYSVLAVNLVKKYIDAFPRVLSALMRYPGREIPDMAVVLDVGPEEAAFKMEAMKNWLSKETDGNSGISLVSFETEGLTRASVRMLEENVIQRSEKPVKYNTLKVKHVPREALFSPDSPTYTLSAQRFNVGDRVVSILDYGKVPLYTRGTVVSIHSYVSRVQLDILFDVEIDSGNMLNNRLQTRRGLSVESNSVLNLSRPQFAVNFKGKANPSSKSSTSNGKSKSKNAEAPNPPAASNAWKSGPAKTILAKKPQPQQAPVAATANAPSQSKQKKDPVKSMNADLSKELLSILHSGSSETASGSEKDPLGIEQSTAEKSKEFSQNRLHSAVMSQYAGAPVGPGNLPPAPNSMFPPGPPGSFMPMPPPVGPNGHPMMFPGHLPPGVMFPGPPPPPNMMMFPGPGPIPSHPQFQHPAHSGHPNQRQQQRNFGNGPRRNDFHGPHSNNRNSDDQTSLPTPPAPRGGRGGRGNSRGRRGGHGNGRNHNNDGAKGENGSKPSSKPVDESKPVEPVKP